MELLNNTVTEIDLVKMKNFFEIIQNRELKLSAINDLLNKVELLKAEQANADKKIKELTALESKVGAIKANLDKKEGELVSKEKALNQLTNETYQLQLSTKDKKDELEKLKAELDKRSKEIEQTLETQSSYLKAAQDSFESKSAKAALLAKEYEDKLEAIKNLVK